MREKVVDPVRADALETRRAFMYKRVCDQKVRAVGASVDLTVCSEPSCLESTLVTTYVYVC